MKTASKGEDNDFPEEGSPGQIFVSDAGWTVIRTGWNELIVVDVAGHDRGRVELLTEAFTKREKEHFVERTTAGPMWAGYSLWYFLDLEEFHLFVLRPWWGRRVVVNLETGKLTPETAAISKQASNFERSFVLDELAKGVKELSKTDCPSLDADIEKCNVAWPIMKACYLAGRLRLKEAIPYLEECQESTFSNGYSSGALGEHFNGEVDPDSYRQFSLRQVAQLSLRRLGGELKPVPLTQHFIKHDVPNVNYLYKRIPYTPQARSGPRDANCDKLRKGMKAEQVLDLLGEPDFNGYDTWEYDMDAKRPYSLSLRWESRKLVAIRKQRPVLWKSTIVRDKQLLP